MFIAQSSNQAESSVRSDMLHVSQNMSLLTELCSLCAVQAINILAPTEPKHSSFGSYRGQTFITSN
jgi:hypothetical protein